MLGEPCDLSGVELGHSGLRVFGYECVLERLAGAMCAATSAEMNPERKTAITTPPLPGIAPQDLVGDVARVIGDSPGAGVGEHDRRLGRVERRGHRRRRDVAQVDQHPEAVHLADDLDAERRQAVVLRRVGRGVGPAGRRQCVSVM